jgi:adenine-specific DNA-methyltransferase
MSAPKAVQETNGTSAARSPVDAAAAPLRPAYYDGMSRAALIGMLEEYDAALLQAGKDGIVMSYTGRAAPWQIIRQVKPKLSRIIRKLSRGDEKLEAENELWDGENLSAMVTLYSIAGRST